MKPFSLGVVFLQKVWLPGRALSPMNCLRGFPNGSKESLPGDKTGERELKFATLVFANL